MRRHVVSRYWIYDSRIKDRGRKTRRISRLTDIALRNWTTFKNFALVFDRPRVQNASTASLVKIWQEYTSKNIANVCVCARAHALRVVSFIFKINYIDSKPKSAVKFCRENSWRNYAVEFLRVQSNGKSWSTCIGIARLPVIRFPASRKIAFVMSCCKLVHLFVQRSTRLRRSRNKSTTSSNNTMIRDNGRRSYDHCFYKHWIGD